MKQENALTTQTNQLNDQMNALTASLTQQYSALNTLLSSLQTHLGLPDAAVRQPADGAGRATGLAERAGACRRLKFAPPRPLRSTIEDRWSRAA